MERDELLREVARLNAAAAGHSREREARAAALAGPPIPGDLFDLPVSGGPPVFWVAVHAHPDDHSLLYTVPADDNPEAGSVDVPAPDTDLGPLVLRCGLGLWARADALARARRLARLADGVVAAARVALAGLAAGTLSPSEDQVAVDADPDYDDWLTELEQAVAAARDWLESPVAGVAGGQALPDFSAPLALAASGGGLFGDLVRLLDGGRPALPPEGVLRTNPVLSLGYVPSALRSRWREACAARGVAPPRGVVGLVHDRSGVALVEPLSAEPAAEWSAEATLPFAGAEVEAALVRLLEAAGIGGLPARLHPLRISGSLGLRSEGTSMTVAGLLAVLAAAGGDPDVLSAACAVVEPDGDALRPADGGTVSAKLAAFVRECGAGSLLVRHPGDAAAAAFDCHFRQVWEAGSFADLARQADAAGLLAPFRRRAPLGRADLARATHRLDRLGNREHHYAEALALAEALADHPVGPDVPPAARSAVRRLAADQLRHLGRFAEAEAAARAARAELESDPATSHDDLARADADRAAAAFDAHRFAEARDALAGWWGRLQEDPRLAGGETRVRVFNTLGRVESVAGGDWLSKFRATLKLQTNDLAEAARTYCYLTRALARHGMLAEAEAALAEVEGLPHMPDFSGWELAFVRAEVARRRGQVWSVAVRDGVTGGPYNRAFYFQATARQAGRSAEDRRERYRRAEAFLRPAPGPGQNLLTMLAEAVRLRAAADAEDTGEWTAARAGLRACLDATGAEGLAAWYGEAWSALGAAPDAEAAEAFLARVPYF